MNVHESEKIAGILEQYGHTAVDDIASADIIVFNTCCIRDTAEAHIYGNIGAAKTLKRQRPDLVIVVCGCMSQKEGTVAKLRTHYPFVDIILGTHNIDRIGQLVADRLNGTLRINEILAQRTDCAEHIPTKRTSGVNAWVNIMYGCDNFCTYCIVPYVRGREKSRSVDAIVEEVSQLVAQGYREITLLGQNVNSYRFSDQDFCALLTRVCAVEGDYWVRFLTSHPKDLSDRVLDLVATQPRLARHIHLPLQSGSDRILSLMNRHYDLGYYLGRVEAIRSRMPDAGLTTDIIVGFPSETEEDFGNTLDAVRSVGFDNIFSFVYSRREGTRAASMPDQIPTTVKKARIAQLIFTQQAIASQAASRLCGSVQTVLVAERSPQHLICRTSSGHQVCVSPVQQDLIGQFVRVRIDTSRKSKLFGTITTEESSSKI